MIQHTVFFDLRDDLTAAQRAEFERGLRSLSGIPSLRRFEFGAPAATGERPVIDRSYAWALYTWFDSVGDHDAYQVHPLHRSFLEQFRSFWTRVRVFDVELKDAESAAPALCRGIHHVALRARDFERSLAFYRDTLGLRVKVAWGDAPARAAMLDTGRGGILEIFEQPDAPPPEENGPLLHFALHVASVDAVIAAARAAGLTVTVEPRSVTIAATGGREPYPVRIAFFRGPDGELVELFEER